MAINSLDELFVAMKGGSYYQPINTQSQGGNAGSIDLSLWRLLSYPLTPAIPGAAAILGAATPGALPLAPRSGAQERIISELSVQMTAAGTNLQIEDRLGHMGGLVGNVATLQNVNLNLDANLAVNNLAARIGSADYSEVEWYLEWYTATGATIATPTVGVVYHDGTAGTCNIWNLGSAALPASVTNARRYKIVPANGKFIRAVTDVTLSVSTGTAGNFGVTARRCRSRVECVIANGMRVIDWSQIRAPKIEDNSCISYAMNPPGATNGVIFGNIMQAVN